MYSSNEDDLTIKLTEIVFVNENIKNFIAKGAPMRNVMVSPPSFFVIYLFAFFIGLLILL